MSPKKTATILILAAIAVLAGTGYLTRHKWMHALPFMQEEAGGFRVVEKEGVKYKECYVCPMHPQVVRPGPGDCPICGMSLVRELLPLEGGKPPEKTEEMPGMEMPAAAGPGTEELRRVSLDPRERMLANVATAKAGYKELSQDVYTVGRIAFNEETIRKVTAWFPGRVERLYVDFTGQTVRKGERIMSVYSPELVSTEKEYLIAKETSARLSASEFPEVSRGSSGVLDSARTRLRLWGMTDAQIDELDRTGQVMMTVDVHSPVSGTVVEIMAREGNYLGEGSELYRVADLSRVWVMAEVYEYEFSKVGLGSKVEVTAEAYPGRTFHGRVVFIDPSVNPESRTVGVRAEVPNPGGKLKPEMFVNARIFSRPVRALTVPASAVLYTGTRDVAWVEVEPGVFESRYVRLGMRSGDEYEVLEGLREGDSVVTQGGFLIDSEAQLRESAGGGMAGMPGMEAGGPPPEGRKTEAPAGHRH